MKNFLKDRKSLSLDQKLEIMIAGKVEVPYLICPKEMTLFGIHKILPLAIKKVPA